MGDGDTGSGIKRACDSTIKILDYLNFDTNLKESIINIGECIAKTFGGTTGALYGAFLGGIASELDNKLENFDLI